MSESSSDEWFVPEITWNKEMIWRGANRIADPYEARSTARKMGELLVPAVTDEGKAALGVISDDAIHLFELDTHKYQHRSEFMTPMQQASQVISEMNCEDAPQFAWEAVVASCNHVLWRPYWRFVEYTTRELAIEEARLVLVCHLRPAAENRQRRDRSADEGWNACVECQTEDEGHITSFRTEASWDSETEAWRHAAQMLAAAEATARAAPERSPIVDWPDSDRRLLPSRQAA